MKKISYLTAVILITLSSCARQTSPNGGPKDTIPPVNYSKLSIPRNGSTNYNQKEVQLEFDEFISLNNPKEQIIITPDVEKKYDIVAKKKKVILTFENDLKDSTTYTINFRNSVQDVTERNSARNLKLAFSTGSYIDSLSITGTVIDPLTNKDVKQATVALYQQDTFNIFKHKPTILTETDEKGKYQIENLKPGKYYIYAILDKNKNIIVDSKNESYAYLKDSINLVNNVNAIVLPLQKLDTRTLKLISARAYNSYFNIKMSKSLKQYKLTSPRGTIQSSFAETQDNIKVFNNGILEGDSIQIKLSATDSSSNNLDTTLYAKFNFKKLIKEPFQMKVESFSPYHTNGTIKAKIQFSKPIAAITFDSITYKIDSTHSITFSQNDLKIDSIKNRLTLEKTIDKQLLAKPDITTQTATKTPPKTKTKSDDFTLLLGKGAFITVEGDSSQKVSEPHRPVYFDETGIIMVEVSTNEQSFVVELLDTSFKIVTTVRNTKKVNFQDLPPADYQIRLIIDRNGDGVWTPGNPITRQNAEPTKIYLTEKTGSIIKLKANFEVGPMLIKY